MNEVNILFVGCRSRQAPLDGSEDNFLDAVAGIPRCNMYKLNIRNMFLIKIFPVHLFHFEINVFNHYVAVCQSGQAPHDGS